MQSVNQMFSLQCMLLIYLVCGIICSRQNIITKDNQPKFTNFVLNILMPCMVFHSFRELTFQKLSQAFSILMISFLICLVSLALGKLLSPLFKKDNRKVMQYALLVNNAGFAGLPLAGELFGEEGLMLASVFLVPIRIFMWSAGITILSDEKPAAKDIVVKLIKNPNIVAVILGIIRGLLQIPLPSFLDSALANLAGCVSPMSMIVIGSIMAQIDFKKLIDRDVILYTALRLILIPLAVCFVLSALGFDTVVVGVSMVLSAMPAATSSVLLASQNDQNVDFATRIVFVSTVLSLIVAPLLITII